MLTPLTPEELKAHAPPCPDPGHAPGVMNMVLTAPMKWTCPTCGLVTVLSPSSTHCAAPAPYWRKSR